MNKYILFEPITIGEILPFIASIILLIITYKSISNAKKGNETTKESVIVAERALELQSKQFKYSIKPNLVFDVPPTKEFSQLKYNKEDIDQYHLHDHEYLVKNYSDNICYNISTKTFIHLDNEGWDKFYKFKKTN